MTLNVDRETAEIERSAAEAKSTILRPSDIARYLNPDRETPYALEYSFYLLGNATGKTVLDFGCGTGENIPALVQRGASVIGLDVSPDLIALADKRITMAGLKADLRVASAYDTGLPDESTDIIFCMSLIHHLDIARVKQEMRRILRRGGHIVLKEPIRFSQTLAAMRRLFPAHEDVSDYEHPLTRDEFRLMGEGFVVSDTRFFRLPFVPLVTRFVSNDLTWPIKMSDWLIRKLPAMGSYASAVVMKLRQ